MNVNDSYETSSTRIGKELKVEIDYLNGGMKGAIGRIHPSRPLSENLYNATVGMFIGLFTPAEDLVNAVANTPSRIALSGDALGEGAYKLTHPESTDDYLGDALKFTRDASFAFVDGAAIAAPVAGAVKSKLASKVVASKLPQGISADAFATMSQTIRQQVGHLSDDIAVHGSRASGTAKATSDIDIAIRVSPEKFNQLIVKSFGSPNAGSAKMRTMKHAIDTGKIQAGEAGMRGLRKTLSKQLDMPVDISVIRKGGSFDKGPYIPIN